jgi:hypothetical protein
LIRSLWSIVGCGGFYHLYFSDVLTLRPLLAPILETLVGIEIELERIAAGPRRNQWTDQHFTNLQKQGTDFVTNFHDAIPPSLRNADKDKKKDLSSWSDCEPKELKVWLDSDIRPLL